MSHINKALTSFIRCGCQTGLAVIVGVFASLAHIEILSAGTGDQSSGMIFPNLKNYYNPLKHGSSGRTVVYSSNLMDNESLLRSVEQLRADTMTQEQRVLNHQWLSQANDEDSTMVGSKVFSALMRMGFKTYWEGNRIQLDADNRMIPNNDGDGYITEEVDYRVRISGDKIKLSLEYEF